MLLSFKTKWNDKRSTYFPEKIWVDIITNFKEYDYCSFLDYNRMVKDKSGYSMFDEVNSLGILPKIHNIREDIHGRWKAGNDIHFYIFSRTSKMVQFAPVIKCISVQDIYTLRNKHGTFYYVDGQYIDDKQLALNDGLTVKRFIDLFQHPFKGKIINWTDKLY